MAAASFEYRSQDQSSDSDSDSSGKDRTDWKKATCRTEEESLEKIPIPLPAALPSPAEQQGPPKRKRNNIWCDVLEDQMISETLDHCGIKNKPIDYGSRGEESYDYTLARKLFKRNNDSDNKMSEDEMSDSADVNSTASFNRKYHGKYVKLDREGQQAAKKIIQILGEKKHYLIFRVVKYIGIKRALEVLKETETIEENGGMLIKNQLRRRTPGGVYFQLLKSDKDLKKEVIDKIFEGELNSFEKKKLADCKRKEKQKLEAEMKKKLLKEVETMVSEETQLGEKKDNNLEVMEEGEVEEAPPLQSVPVVSNTKGSDLEDGEIDD